MTPPTHGGKRIHRKTKGRELQILHAEIAPELCAWIADVAESRGTSKAEALERILEKAKRRALRVKEKACLQHDFDASTNAKTVMLQEATKHAEQD